MDVTVRKARSRFPMLVRKVHLYANTLRYLRFGQIVNRIWRRICRPISVPLVALTPRVISGLWVFPPTPATSIVAPTTFRFLNVERICATDADWQTGDASHLWLYNLHYFDDLNAVGAASRASLHRELIGRWVRENPIGKGVGWEPYPTSRRIVNWVKWVMCGNNMSADGLVSLAIQSRWLVRRLEYHILGNHLLANAKALVYAGLFFDGPEASHWFERGIDILDKQIREQILPDGGHFELSPMYHAIVLEDLLDVVNCLRAYRREVSNDWLNKIAWMQHWLQAMIHPDGEIAFFNDAAFGIAQIPLELNAYSVRLGLQIEKDECEPVTVLNSSGYVRALIGRAYLVCDCAQIGPSYLPGHGHADTLSFEFSLDGKRVFVNSGTSVYGTDLERHRQRGTATHNTVVVDGENSSEVWGGFRVARRARAKLACAALSANGERALIDASHDGYRRLVGRVEHRRCWALNEHSLRIDDNLSGKFDRAEACFHLHPSVEVTVIGPSDIELSWSPSAIIRISFSGAATVVVSDGTWHPEFGLTVTNKCISVKFSGTLLSTYMTWGQS